MRLEEIKIGEVVVVIYDAKRICGFVRSINNKKDGKTIGIEFIEEIKFGHDGNKKFEKSVPGAGDTYFTGKFGHCWYHIPENLMPPNTFEIMKARAYAAIK